MPRQALMQNKNQHLAKNQYSKSDDLNIDLAMQQTKEYLENRFANGGGVSNFIEGNYYFEIKKQIEISFMIENIKLSKIRAEFDSSFFENKIKPDGGVLFLRKKDDRKFKKILLITEAKRQGTNDIRTKQGKNKQATGNAIERLGKNLTGIKAMLNHEKITPFVCFGWGCDFASDEKTVLAKLNVLNEFYYL
ncbi:restriction endonuclease, partial [Campylobacter jejuni]